MSIEESSVESAPPACPKCGGQMWDNRASKRNPRAPDYKCKDRSCDGVIWPPRGAAGAAPPPIDAATPAAGVSANTEPFNPDDPKCPVCGGPMWDDRFSKRNPRAPDFKCKDKPKTIGGPGCQGVIWPPRDGERRTAAPAPARAPQPRATREPVSPPPLDEAPPPDDRDFADDDDLPF